MLRCNTHRSARFLDDNERHHRGPDRADGVAVPRSARWTHKTRMMARVILTGIGLVVMILSLVCFVSLGDADEISIFGLGLSCVTMLLGISLFVWGAWKP
jgi:uncharacterized membrane protein